MQGLGFLHFLSKSPSEHRRDSRWPGAKDRMKPRKRCHPDDTKRVVSEKDVHAFRCARYPDDLCESDRKHPPEGDRMVVWSRKRAVGALLDLAHAQSTW